MSDAERVGRYRLAGVIGVGSFATVHRAVDDRLDDVVVVKLLAENHSLNPEVRERFIAEGRALRRIRSPHVVTVHDIGETERQQPYLVLDLAERGTLADRVAARRAEGWRATAGDVLDVARTLAAAIEAVHAAELVHRDLSPGNVLLRRLPEHARRSGPATLLGDDEELLLADLGMSKDLARSSGLTVAGGTEGFRPPEQRSPGPVDHRADLWALSALIGWLVEGAELPPALGLALDRSLADSPDDRHPDVASWLADVEAALAPTAPSGAGDESGAGGRSPHPPAATVAGGAVESPAATTPAAARRWIAVAAVVAALVVGALLGSVLTDRSTDPVANRGDARIAIEGPQEAEVGEPVTLTAEVAGLASWVWVLPTGEHVADADEVTVTARTPGRAEVVLRARAPDGTDLEASWTITVAG